MPPFVLMALLECDHFAWPHYFKISGRRTISNQMSGGRESMSGGQERANYELFDAQGYLAQLFGDITLLQNVQTYVDLFAQFPNKSITVLDCGGGPNVFPLIMSAEKVTRYVHSDYAKNNRDEVERWKDKDPGAFSWKENIRRCLKVEGKSGSDEEVAIREDLMRSALKAVVPCDVTADRVVGEEYEGPYDVVTCAYCLECVFQSFEALSDAIGRISKLVKPGGYFILTVSSILDPGEPSYLVDQIPVAGFKYRSFLCAPAQSYLDAFKAHRYTVVGLVQCPYRHPTLNIEDVYAIIVGKKEPDEAHV